MLLTSVLFALLFLLLAFIFEKSLLSDALDLLPAKFRQIKILIKLKKREDSI